jgi:hypothetical protein
MRRLFGGFCFPNQFPIIANIGNFLNEHGGVRGEVRFPPNVAIIRGILFSKPILNHYQYWQFSK